jgi:hypothetical protein
MRLVDWMQSKDINDTKMADMIGVSRVAVCMYRNDQRIPKKSIMINIMDVTKGKVMANDFYLGGSDE